MPAAGRSTKVQVIAILNLVGGGLGLIQSLFTGFALIVQRSAGGGVFTGGGGGAAPGTLDGVELQNYIIRTVPGYAVFQFGEFGIGLLFDLMLIASGLGLLWYQKWARGIALIWAGMSIVKKIVVVGYHLFAVLPAVNTYLNTALANLPPAQADAMRIGGMVGGSMGICFEVVLLAYPIVVLCLLLSKSATQAFEPDEFGDDDRSRGDEDNPLRRRSPDRERGRDRDRFRSRDDDEGGRY